MPLSGSWISAKYLFKNKFKALNLLLNSAKYTITRERVFLFACLKVLLGHCDSGGLNVTIMSKAVVYASAEGHSFYFAPTLASSAL
jgi:hypothetical protein